MTKQQLREAIRKIIKQELNENKQYQKGDIVIPNKGPHKGEKHKVIHVDDNGTVNIQPISSKKVQYKLGAVKAKPEDLSEGPYENQPSQTPSKPKTEPAVHPGKPSTDKPKPRRPFTKPEGQPGPKAEATMKEAEMLKQVIKRFKSKK